MALMVTDAYTARSAGLSRRHARSWTTRAAQANGASFMQASPAQRLALLETLDREQKTAMDERATRRGRARRGAEPAATSRPTTSA